jgi:hypothetical protein
VTAIVPAPRHCVNVHQQPATELRGWGMGALLVFFAVIVMSVLLVPLRRKVLRGERHKPRDEAAADYVSVFVSAVYLILLAFVVVVLWQRVDDVNADTRAEAADLTQLTWLAHRLPAADHAALRTTVRDYATAVLTYEFPPGAHTEAGAADLDQARERLATPTTFGQSSTMRDLALGYLDDIQSNRDDRLAKSDLGLSGLLLAAVVVLSVATLLIPYLLGPRIDAHSVLGLMLTAAVIVAGLLLVWDLMNMYSGMFKVDPAPLRAALEQLDRVS